MKIEKQYIDPSLNAHFYMVIRTIVECFKPLEQDIYYWKSYKDSDGKWRKRREELSDKDIANILSERSWFIRKSPLLSIIEGEVFFNSLIDRSKLVKLFNEYINNGCDDRIYLKLRAFYEDV